MHNMMVTSSLATSQLFTDTATGVTWTPNLTPQVHLVLLLPKSSSAHPATPLLQALHARLRTQHPGARILASSIAYPRSTSALAVQPCSKAWCELSLEQASQELEALVEREEEEEQVDANSKSNVLAGMVAAIEHFAAISPLPLEAVPTSLEPRRAPVLARHVLHISCTSLALPPLSTALSTALNSHHDTWSFNEAAQGLREASITWSSLILPCSAEGGMNEARSLHAQLGNEADATQDQLKSFLGEAVPQQGVVLLIRGLTSAPALIRKRSRSKASTSPASLALEGVQVDAKRRKANAATTSPVVVVPTPPIDAASRTLLSRLLFLLQQVGMMMNHLSHAAVAARKQDAQRNVAIEKLRVKLTNVRQAFHAQHAALAAGAQVNDLNNSIAALLAVNQEAAQLGIELGLRAAAASTQPGSNTQQASSAQATAGAAGGGAAGGAAGGGAAAGGAAAGGAAAGGAAAAAAPAPSFPSRSQPIWQGPICWSVTDPSNGAKREVQAFVSATASTKTFSNNVSLPWPARLLMQSTIPLHMPSLHAFGMRNTPCVLFTPKAPPASASAGSAAGKKGEVSVDEAVHSSTNNNEEAYKGFAQMLEARKLCGFIPWRDGPGSPGGGILVVATPTPTSTATQPGATQGQGGGSLSRLFGLIFHDSAPLKQLIANATVAQRLLKEQTQQQQQSNAAVVPNTKPSTNAPPPQALFQSAPPSNSGPPQASVATQGFTQHHLDVQRQAALQMQNARSQFHLQGTQSAQLIMAQAQARTAAAAGLAVGPGVGAGTTGFTTQPSLSDPGSVSALTVGTNNFTPASSVPGPPSLGSAAAWNFGAHPAAAAYAAGTGTGTSIASNAATATSGSATGTQQQQQQQQHRGPNTVAPWTLMGPGAPSLSAAEMAALSAQLGLATPDTTSSASASASAGKAGAVPQQMQNLWGNWSTNTAQPLPPQQQQQQQQQANQQQPDYATLQRMLSGNQP